MPENLKSKGGAEIKEGDTVMTPIRGGKHEFEVSVVLHQYDTC